LLLVVLISVEDLLPPLSFVLLPLALPHALQSPKKSPTRFKVPYTFYLLSPQSKLRRHEENEKNIKIGQEADKNSFHVCMYYVCAKFLDNV
jgi:hypothetical protein